MRPTVLVVDDDRAVRSYMQLALERNHFEVIAPASASEALSLLETSDRKIGAVVSDVAMPDMDGFTFARAVTSRFPEMPILMVSGCFPDNPEPQRFPLLRKPFGPAALVSAVRRLFGA